MCDIAEGILNIQNAPTTKAWLNSSSLRVLKALHIVKNKLPNMIGVLNTIGVMKIILLQSYSASEFSSIKHVPSLDSPGFPTIIAYPSRLPEIPQTSR